MEEIRHLMEIWEKEYTSLGDGRDHTSHLDIGEILHLTERWERSYPAKRNGRNLTPH
jgi:hypothetical protein